MQLFSPKNIVGVVNTVVVFGVVAWYVYMYSRDEHGRLRFPTDKDVSKILPEGHGLYLVGCYVYHVVFKDHRVLGLNPHFLSTALVAPAEEMMRSSVWGNVFLIYYELWPKLMYLWDFRRGKVSNRARYNGIIYSMLFHSFMSFAIAISYLIGVDPHSASEIGLRIVAHAGYNSVIQWIAPHEFVWAQASALAFAMREFNSVKEEVLSVAADRGMSKKMRKVLVKATKKFETTYKFELKKVVHRPKFAKSQPASWIDGFRARRIHIERNGKRCLNLKPGNGVTLLSKGAPFMVGNIECGREEYRTEMLSSLIGLPELRVKADDCQFDELKEILSGLKNKGIDLNIRTGLDRVFNPVNSECDNGIVSSFDMKSMMELLDITPDIGGLCKAIMYIVVMGEVRKHANSRFVNVLTGLSQTAVLYRVFTKFELYTHLNKLTTMMMGDAPEYKTEAGASTILDLINACFTAYFAGGAMGASSLADLATKLSKAKQQSVGMTFGIKTISDYLSYVLNALLGSDCSLVDGDVCLVKAREMTKLAVKYIRTEGQAAVGLKKLAECRDELEKYRAVLLKDEANPNRTVLLQTCVDMIKNISVLADTYDTSSASAGLDKRMLMVTLAGPSRIGKSETMQSLATAHARFKNKDNKEVWSDIALNANNYFTIVKQGGKHLDMTAQTCTIIIDDADVFKMQNATQMTEVDILEWQVGTAARPKVDGASIESKNLSVSADLMIRGTNVVGATLRNQTQVLYNHPDAKKRRVHEHSYLVYVNKEFAVDPEKPRWERELDVSKVSRHDKTFPHLWYVKHDLYEEKDLGDPMSYAEFESTIINALKKRTDDHETKSRAYYDANVEAFKAMDPSWIPPPYEGPCARTEKLRQQFSLTEAAMRDMKKGFLTDLERGTEQWAEAFGAYIVTTLDIKADSLGHSIMNWATNAVSSVWGYRREITGALVLMGTYNLISSFIEQAAVFTAESGAPKPVRSDVRKPSQWNLTKARLAKLAVKEDYKTEVGLVGAPTMDVSTKLLSNMFSMRITVPHPDGTSSSVPLANGFQSGQVVFFPSHYVPTIDAYFEEFPKAIVDFCFDDGKSYSVDKLAFASDNMMTGTLFHDDDDLTSLHLKSAPNKQNLLKYLMTTSEVNGILKAGRVRVLYAQTEHLNSRQMTLRNSTLVNAFASSDLIYIKDEIAKGKWGDNEYGVSRCLHTEKVVSTSGHCGNLYFTDQKILAMHVSASPTRSVGLILSKDDLEAHVQFHADRDVIARVSETLPTMSPIPDEYRTEKCAAIGVVECPIPRMKVRVKPSPLNDLADKVGIKGDYEVMKLDIASQQLCMMDRPDNIKPINHDRLSAVVSHKWSKISPALSLDSVPSPVGKISVAQVLDGIPEENIPSMNRSSSMGYMAYRPDLFGLRKDITRSAYLGEIGFSSESYYYESICREIDRFIAALAEGRVDYDEFPLLFVCAIPKDEFRKKGKSTRVVYCYTPLLNIAINMYFARPVAKFKAAGLATNVAYINPHAQAWELFEHLTAGVHSGPVEAVDLDYSAWDTQLHPVAFRESLKALASLGEYTGSDAVVVASLISILTGPVILVAKDARNAFVMKLHAGLASGSPVTSVGNSLANDILLGYGISVTGHHLDEVRPDELERIDHVRSTTHGDDLVAVPDDIMKADGFCYSSLAAHMSELGLRPQPITKDGVIVEYKPLVACDESDTTCIEFLCRNFVRRGKSLTLANKNETNAKQLLFRNDGYEKLDKSAKEARWNEFFVEVSARGEDYYNKYRNAVYPALLREGIGPVCGSSYAMCMLKKADVIDAMMWI